MLEEFSDSKNQVLQFVRHGAVLLPDVGSSSCHPLSLDVGHHVQCEVMWEDEWKHNVTMTSDHPKHHHEDWVFGFSSLSENFLRIEQANILLFVHYLILTEKKVFSDEGNTLVCSKVLHHNLPFVLHGL